MAAFLISSFGLLALVLASIGMYGVIAFSVAQRTREMGIHLALGAPPLRDLKMVNGEGMGMVGAGVLLGLVLAVAAMRPIAAMLYDVPALDIVAFGAATSLLLLVAPSASLIPARRASTVSLVEALRSE